MKRLITYSVIIVLLGCSHPNKGTFKKGLPEKEYPFLADITRPRTLDYLEAIVDFRQFGSFSKNLWIRKPENLKLVFSSLKQIGFKKFISEVDFNKPLFTDHWAETCWKNKSLNQIVQNLISSFSESSGHNKYYIEFWNRRKVDGNEAVFIQILRDINNVYNSEDDSEEVHWESDAIITRLLEFEIERKQSDSIYIKEINIAYHNYLRTIGLYVSANNLLRYENQSIINEFDKNDDDYLELINQIEIDSVSYDEYWAWRESANWFREIYDYK